MKKSISKVQMIVGIVLCALLIIGTFLPSFDVAKLGNKKWLMNFAKSSVSEVLEEDEYSAADIQESIEEVAGRLEDQMDEICEGLEKAGLPTKCSNFYFMTHSLETIMYKYSKANGGDYKSVNEMMEDLEDDYSDSEMKVYKKVSASYNYYRIFLVVMGILPLLILIFILLAWFDVWRKGAPIILSWLLEVMSIFNIFILFVMFPKAILKLSGTEEKMIKNFVESFMQGLTAIGFYISIIVATCLAIWGIWCCVRKASPENQIFSGVGSIPDNNQMGQNFVQFSSLQEIGSGAMQSLQNVDGQMYGQENQMYDQPSQMYGQPGQMYGQQSQMQDQWNQQQTKIRGIVGTIIGAEFSIQPGERVMIGRDPSECQLILNDIKVSRKHCMVEYDSIRNCYHIECFSKNGVWLSDGRKILQGQSADVIRGTQLYMADKNEILSLD